MSTAASPRSATCCTSRSSWPSSRASWPGPSCAPTSSCPSCASDAPSAWPCSTWPPRSSSPACSRRRWPTSFRPSWATASPTRAGMARWPCWPSPSRGRSSCTSTSPATRTWRGARRGCSASACRATSSGPTAPSRWPSSGVAGTSRSGPGCATTSTSRWVARAGVTCAPPSTSSSRCPWPACGTGSAGAMRRGACCRASASPWTAGGGACPATRCCPWSSRGSSPSSSSSWPASPSWRPTWGLRPTFTSRLLVPSGGALPGPGLLAVIGVGMAGQWMGWQRLARRLAPRRSARRWLAYGVALAAAVVLLPSSSPDFIYQQF